MQELPLPELGPYVRGQSLGAVEMGEVCGGLGPPLCSCPSLASPPHSVHAQLSLFSVTLLLGEPYFWALHPHTVAEQHPTLVRDILTS